MVRAIAMAEIVGANAPIALKLAKESIHLVRGKEFENGLRHECDIIMFCTESEDGKEGMLALAKLQSLAEA